MSEIMPQTESYKRQTVDVENGQTIGSNTSLKKYCKVKVIALIRIQGIKFQAIDLILIDASEASLINNHPC